MKSILEFKQYRRNGFTLVELLVVIAIIGVLVALLLPAVQAAREAARRSQCLNNLKQIGLGLINHEDSQGRIPYGALTCCDGAGPNKNKVIGDTWITAIFPYMEYQNLHENLDLSVTFRHPTLNLPVIENASVSVFVCPSSARASNPIFDDRFARDNPGIAQGTWYAGSMGPTDMVGCPLCPLNPLDMTAPTPDEPDNYCCQGRNFGHGGNGNPLAEEEFVGVIGRLAKPTITFAKIADGTSNTFMVGEVLPEESTFFSLFSTNFNATSTSIPVNTRESNAAGNIFGHSPTGQWQRVSGFKSEHPGGCHMLMVDGSVHFINEDIDRRLFNELGTRDGGEVASLGGQR